MGEIMEGRKISKRSRKKTSINKVVIFSFIAVLALCLVLIYLMFAQIFYARFLPNTYISGMNVSFKTVKDVEKLIDEKIEAYKLVIKSKDGEDTIYGRDIGLKRIYGTTVPEFLASQRPIAWIKNLDEATSKLTAFTIFLDIFRSIAIWSITATTSQRGLIH